MVLSTAILGLSDLQVETVKQDEHEIKIYARPRQRAASCPRCGYVSRQVHSYYVRRPVDLPIGHKRTRLILHVRRFRCLDPTCPAATFSELLPSCLARYARRSRRLSQVLGAIASELGGRAGSRLAQRLQIGCSGDTLIRLVRRAAGPVLEPPTVIGVDDWAKRRGRQYGTLIVDLERRRPIELLADRRAETLEAWLRQHPTIRVLARDRYWDYIAAANRALPECQQVADRWHLLCNLRATLERLANRQRLRLREPEIPPAPERPREPDHAPIPIVRLADHLRYGAEARHQLYLERQDLFERMQTLHRQGLSAPAIARLLGVAPNTVRSYLDRGGPPPEFHPLAPRPKLIDRFVPHLSTQWQAGCRNASQLWREIQAQGFPGPRSLVARWVRQRREWPSPNTPPRYRAAFQSSIQAPVAASAQPHALPDAHTLSWVLLRSPDQLTTDEAAWLHRMRSLPILRTSHELAQSLAHIIRTRAQTELASWMAQARQSGITEWKTFAKGLGQDLSAVENALRMPWSNGQTEGQVNRLKLLKRQMYGRARFDLLRARFLHPP